LQASGGSFKPHPVLVLSNDTVYESEEAFIGVMISGSDVSDSFSFPLTNEMLTKPMKKQCQMRCQLIMLFDASDVIAGKKSEMRIAPFKQLLKHINSSVFLSERLQSFS
jgi:hypothetical protein